MKNLKFKYKKELLAYATAFASFVIPKLFNVKAIILFGSVARGEADKKSDIDLFFDLENKEDEVGIKKILENELNKFYKSKIAENWLLKGIKNEIKIHAGKLEEWKLKRSIISDGIFLYGKYREEPENLKSFVFFNIKPIKNITKRNRVIRKLFGRKEKKYFSDGVVNKVKGKKLSASSFIVPLEYTNEIIRLLNEEKIDYSFFEFWSDQINI